MQWPQALRLPTRVSRFYPAFSLTLALAVTVTTIGWQKTQIELVTLADTVGPRVNQLEEQVDILSRQQKIDKATMAVQQQRITESNQKLTDLEKELSTRKSELASTQQQLKDAQSQLERQNAQLSQNASELEKLRSRPPLFSFQNYSSNPDMREQQDSIKQLITDAYDYIQRLYGAPYLLQGITIQFVDTLSISGSSGEIVIENGSSGIHITIKLTSFDKDSFRDINTVLHEVIHGFHGVAVFDTAALEEGITVAATDAVMREMAEDGKIPAFPRYYINLTDAEYARLNASTTVKADSDAFYGSNDVATVYQMIGKAWYTLYEQDHDFFKKFNAAYYPKAQRGAALTDSTVRETVKAVIPSVNNVPVADYISQNKAFNPH